MCCEKGIDSTTESTKGTKDCKNGFFFAVCVFFVAKNRVYALAGCFGRDDLPIVREGSAAPQPYPTEYRSVTLGNGNVLRRNANSSRGGGASRAAPLDQDVSGGTPALPGKIKAIKSH